MILLDLDCSIYSCNRSFNSSLVFLFSFSNQVQFLFTIYRTCLASVKSDFVTCVRASTVPVFCCLNLHRSLDHGPHQYQATSNGRPPPPPPLRPPPLWIVVPTCLRPVWQQPARRLAWLWAPTADTGGAWVTSSPTQSYRSRLVPFSLQSVTYV